jgi:large subunit ribosomal protein L15
MKLSNLAKSPGSTHARKRIGRGIGSGHGKTSCRGHKGLKAHDTVRPGFEGGQTPLYMRLRKHRGLAKGSMPQHMFRRDYAIINVADLAQLAANLSKEATISPQMLLDTGAVRKMGEGLRVLGNGELTAPITVYAHHFSAAAKEKIEAAGGKALVLALHALVPTQEGAA